MLNFLFNLLEYNERTKRTKRTTFFPPVKIEGEGRSSSSSSLRYTQKPGSFGSLVPQTQQPHSVVERVIRAIAPRNDPSPPPARVETALTVLADEEVRQRDRAIIVTLPPETLMLLADLLVQQRLRGQGPSLTTPDGEPEHDFYVFGG